MPLPFFPLHFDSLHFIKQIKSYRVEVCKLILKGPEVNIVGFTSPEANFRVFFYISTLIITF